MSKIYMCEVRSIELQTDMSRSLHNCLILKIIVIDRGGVRIFHPYLTV